MTDELTFDERLRRAINLITWEKWEGKSTQEIVDVIYENIGDPERIATLEGEIVSAYVVSRSRVTDMLMGDPAKEKPFTGIESIIGEPA